MYIIKYIMEDLTHFFLQYNILQEILPIIHGQSDISLRILDYFVNHYSPKYNTNVFLDYKNQLNIYNKRLFDPFARTNKISFYDLNNNEIHSSIGQLNFFKWVIQNNIIDLVHDNLYLIHNDMNAFIDIRV